ncbi:MAG: hypothetical protein V7641_5021 [Blastocatellia bacterium]
MNYKPKTAANPRCPRCGGRSSKRGRSRGGQVYGCLESCRRHFMASYTANHPMHTAPLNPHCTACRSLMRKLGKDTKGRQRYYCKSCGHYYPVTRIRNDKPSPQSNPWHVACRKRMRKASKDQHGKMRYRCNPCGCYYTANRPRFIAPVPAPANIRRARQSAARSHGAALLDVVAGALPRNLPADLREDVAQEMALAALAGDFDLSDLARMVPYYQRQMSKLRVTDFSVVSLDAVIAGAGHLTYGETLAG